jgi:hypothetical protein
MWTWRNKAIFDEDFQYPTYPIQVILKMVTDIDECEHYHFTRGLQRLDTIFIQWKCPNEGWVKFDCDGAHKKSVDLAGCGGLLRDSNGQWIQGYTQKIRTCDALHAEMWGIYARLELPRRK